MYTPGRGQKAEVCIGDRWGRNTWWRHRGERRRGRSFVLWRKCHPTLVHHYSHYLLSQRRGHRLRKSLILLHNLWHTAKQFCNSWQKGDAPYPSFNNACQSVVWQMAVTVTVVQDTCWWINKIGKVCPVQFLKLQWSSTNDIFFEVLLNCYVFYEDIRLKMVIFFSNGKEIQHHLHMMFNQSS